jgi:hypothetical protein
MLENVLIQRGKSLLTAKSAKEARRKREGRQDKQNRFDTGYVCTYTV